MNANPQSSITVYYDGACPVCRREIGYYQGRTGEGVTYCDVASTDDPAPDLTRDAALKRFHVRLADGKLVSGAAAFLALWEQMPGFSRVAALISAKPILAVLDVAYLGFLQLRKIWR